MGDRQDGAGVAREVLLEPQHRLGVQMVGRLVEQQQVGCGQQQPAQRHPTAFTTESTLGSASPGGQRNASIACSICASRSQALA